MASRALVVASVLALAAVGARASEAQSLAAPTALVSYTDKEFNSLFRSGLRHNTVVEFYSPSCVSAAARLQCTHSLIHT